VATDVAGMREAAGPDVELVPADDPPALARAILTQLATPTVAAQAVPRSFDDVAADHLRVFEAALARRHGTPRASQSCA
jgi:hypothetical protein